MKLVVVICVLIHTCLGIKDLSSEYPFNATLVEGEYYLYWNFSKAADSIQFGVRVKTTGWIGFGLSPSGQMVGSDVIIGWIDNEGTVYYHVSGMHVESRLT